MIETSGETPEQTMLAVIGIDMKSKKEKSAFIKVSPGVIGINPNYSEKEQRQEEKVEENEEEEKTELVTNTQYIGTAGEHLVVSELLFRGYNASTMSVDEGLDIVATKTNNLYNIQVKTANVNKFNRYVYDIRKISFEKFGAGNTFYIFVLRGKKTNFLILPSMEIEKNLQQKNILLVNQGKRYRVNLSIKQDKVYLGNLNNDISFYFNNWNLIK